jgi:GGDEF domain-containing protein
MSCAVTVFYDVSEARALSLMNLLMRFGDCRRASDTVSHIGADKFVILLSDVVRTQDAVIGAGKIYQAVRLPDVIDEYDPHVTARLREHICGETLRTVRSA